ncbi:MAG: sugar phosphate isomerase/epimerase [Armatimonadetes bacterium]|nr:sugar phosphate isomerase/epimerase [Armatimonadota bacterium]
MKTGVCQWVFNKLLIAGEIDMPGCIEFVGNETEADCFEPLSRYWAEGGDENEQAREARALLDEVGLEVSSYTLDSDFAVYDDSAFEDCVQTQIARLDTADILGTDHIRLDPRSSLPSEQAENPDMDYILGRMAEGMADIADAAAGRGIKVGIENHGLLVGKVDLVARLVELVDRPNFGVNLDPTNFYVVHGEDYIEATRRLADRVTHVHLKDYYFADTAPDDTWNQVAPHTPFVKSAVGGEGDAEWVTLLSILRDAGYDGTVSLEVSVPDDIFGSVRTGVANLKRVIAEVEGS